MANHVTDTKAAANSEKWGYQQEAEQLAAAT